MSDADLLALLRPHVQRIADAILARSLSAEPYAPEPATFSAGGAAHFTAADAARFADYFTDTDGLFPSHMHALFGCNPREFADHSGLVRKQITDKNQHKVWHWVRRDQASAPATPQSRNPHDPPASTSPAAPRNVIPDPADKPGALGRAKAAVVEKMLQTKGGRAALALGGGAWHVVHALEKRAMFVAKKVQTVAAKAVEERGFPPERAENLKHALYAADFLGGYATGAAAVAAGMPAPVIKAAMFMPSASVAYLAYSTAMNPKATWRAAKKVLADTFSKEQGVATHAAEVPDDYESDGLMLADAMKDAADPDMFVALFCAALGETEGDVRASVELAAWVAQDDDEDEPVTMSEEEYESFGAPLHEKTITVRPKKGKPYQKTVHVTDEEPEAAKPAAKAKTEAPKPPKPLGNKLTKAELDAHMKWRAARAAERAAERAAKLEKPAKKLTKKDQAKAAQREKFARLAAENYVKSSGLEIGEPGSQLTEKDRDKITALQMVGSFPPAHVMAQDITIAVGSAKSLKDKAVMQWDQETQAGRISGQRRYIKGFSENNSDEKHARVKRLEPYIKKARETLMKTMMNAEAKPQDQDAAAIALIIMETGLRPTDGKESVKHGHYGIASLQARHVKVTGDEVKLKFIGKGGKLNPTTIRDLRVVEFIKETMENREPREPIWVASSNHAGEALKKAVVAAGGNNEVMLKDLRTRVATINGLKAVENFKGPPPPLTGDKEEDEKIYAKAILKMSGEVAKVLNNGAKMARDNYIAPFVFRDWRKKVSSEAKKEAKK